MLAVFLEHAERWEHPAFAVGLLALIALLALTRPTRVGLLLFLVVTTIQLVAMQFPDVANHVNLILYVNLLLICSIGYSLTRAGACDSDDAWFDSIRPLLQLTLVLVYFLAGFHKLNTDFINPDVSCVQRTITQLRQVFRTSLLGIPAALVLGVGGAVVAFLLLARARLHRNVIRLLVLGGVMGTAIFALLPADAMDLPVKTIAASVLIVVVLCWELVGGPLLLVPRAQLAVVAFSWGMHASLALVSFVDFGSLALALLFTFVPNNYQHLIGAPVTVLRRQVPRPLCYLALALVVGLCNLWSTLAAGIVFNAATLVVIWPLLTALVGRTPRLPWPGVPLRLAGTPRLFLLFPVVLLFHAFTGYLGLRTAGNFSMFSNLRTEGPRSNHLLLGSNPLKIWGYQEDVVHFVEAYHQTARIGYNYQSLQGNSLPVVEFRKLIQWWTEAGRTVPLTFEYRGTRYSTQDIVRDPTWRAKGWDWEMRLMDFRVIQVEGANRCRW